MNIFNKDNINATIVSLYNRQQNIYDELQWHEGDSAIPLTKEAGYISTILTLFIDQHGLNYFNSLIDKYNSEY